MAEEEPETPFENLYPLDEIEDNYSHPDDVNIKNYININTPEGIVFLRYNNEEEGFEYWSKNKKDAHNLKVPVSIDCHSLDVKNLSYNNYNFERNTDKLHQVMLNKLKPLERRVYELLYIENKSEEEVAEIMNYTTSEKGRPKGYKHIKNIKSVDPGSGWWEKRSNKY